MKITILCSSAIHPINAWLDIWIAENKASHEVDLVRNKSEITAGDILFLISCSEIIAKTDREAYKKTLVIHASDLPQGRGWSPHVWQILQGQEELTVSLLEAEDQVDSGDIWQQLKINIPKDALYDEINTILFDAEISLMSFAVSSFNDVEPKPQLTDIDPTYYSKRSPEDSEIDPALSIAEQFNKIRISDPERFPAFFRLYGKKFRIVLEKIKEVSVNEKKLTFDLKINECQLRDFTVDDSQLVFNWRNSDKVSKFMCTDHTIREQEHTKWFNDVLRHHSKDYQILEYAGRPIGQVNISRKNRYNGTCHWGFYIGDINAPKGSGTVLAYLALEYIFNIRGFRKVYGEVLDFNQRSIVLHEKVGFLKEGLLMAHVRKDGRFCDVLVYSIFKDQWNKLKNDIC
ncbi:MAG: UDP-4-amino-4,6-dideoxy-N-acetyl-beta-L-altrosamine N-acetyltransferase [Gammaproteobacteria bacterium]|nr:UDP-4-amino-4,6-dideoxy-N-acetyl-beta-L-altrosamine N-acetyltransferase [Gammaproteobacteria bacterium]